MWDILAYLALGAFTGVVAGLLGVGGGLIIVPVLVWLFTRQQVDSGIITHLAIGTSLATIIPTAIASTLAHHRHGAVQWQVIRQMAPGVMLGALAGATLAEFMSAVLLRQVFGVFEILMGIYLLMSLPPRPGRQLPGPAVLNTGGGMIGGVSALLGIGGGTLMVPFMVWFNIHLRHAIATAAATGLPIALAGTAGFMIHGWGHAALPAFSSGYVHWPAFAGIALAAFFTARIGAWLTHRLPVKLVRRVFALLLIGLGLRMIGVGG
ncbi:MULTISPECIES: sulfite exporter TauE/SafE family protein [Ectothiorhodospira]|uniref:sulfite exporter TauE/SafE family protein n=1 Tax=Ectothiorhodospira TaxID=1051 RepID=UPI001EE9A07A|nr:MULTISPECIES: sulfite exporter TauE/SafE family protein [Ectothiorhodospira]MCG5495921.1 sulfite exporter TauE/SafE family protein [Ectothiorhodospira variabilis]MCG5499007.1 sulfite exporter TauE/SafE family protein [Ectothiorhodospira variabilis]MCG5505380.1 sulfite exporter TauE/SafE family protein [Ectothiorhodospira variabilis]MCG5508556.1 sulfite exporter TauE/SafE family protein [Ectothiorhodospira variabilis]MCG5525798.1 sulfite exporter TauE/SafE family protein [Ectothiorhodospira 